MKPKQLHLTMVCCFVLLAIVLSSVTVVFASSEAVLHSFDSLRHGANPESTLIADGSGNLYGTTYDGGAYGTVFELSPAHNNKWQYKLIYNFLGGPTSGPDGATPAAGVIFDGAGNLYGTTSSGGGFGCGTVFELSLSPRHEWKETILYSFNCSDGGSGPLGALVFDKSGNLYGTTLGGGSASNCQSCGVVFELSPGPHGGWEEKVLYSFQGNNNDGCYPTSSLVFDQYGNLYGTASQSGGNSYSCFGGGGGAVFELSPAYDGTWTETVLHEFTGGNDGGNPLASLIWDNSGNLYGTTSAGGTSNDGAVFELSPQSNGTWTESVLHNFGGSDGNYPAASLTFDSTGRLYGTTQVGGVSNFGTIFRLSLVSGTWQEVVLYNFTGGRDGSSPVAGLLPDSAGNFYTTTFSSGVSACSNPPGCGTVVRLSASSVVKVLYDFPATNDGKGPDGALIADSSGSLYGTTILTGHRSQQCSTGCDGAVYKLTQGSNGKWVDKLLYTFPQYKGDGEYPHSNLVFDSKGNLYGTTESGGTSTYLCGTVFELMPSANGMWREQVLYSFQGGAQDGSQPMGSLLIDGPNRLYGTTAGNDNGTSTVFQLTEHDTGWKETVIYNFGGNSIGPSVVMDDSGNLYGTTSYVPGNGLYGGVFELSRSGSVWFETILYAFSGPDGDEDFPGDLVFGEDGSLYGTAYQGGLYDAGVVFKLTPGSSGTWTETVLHDFAGVDGDGGYPMGKLIFDHLGNLYGTTSIGGINGGQCNGLGCGIAYELSPSSDGIWSEHILHRFTGGLDGGSPEAGLVFDSSGDLLGTTNGGGTGEQGTVVKIKH